MAAERELSGARPAGRAVHADPDAPETPELLPLPEAVARTPVEHKSPAEWAYERLILYIRNFEERLAPDEELAMGFGAADAGLLRIEGLGYFAPDLVTFYGRDDNDAKTQLIQHVSQLSVTLRAVPRAEGDGAARRIGFRLAADLESR